MINFKNIIKKNIIYEDKYDEMLNVNYKFIFIKRNINNEYKINAKLEFTNKNFSKSTSLLTYMRKNNYLLGINGGLFNTSTNVPECVLIKDYNILIDKDETYEHKSEEDGENKRNVLYSLGIKTNGQLKCYGPKFSAKQLIKCGCKDVVFGFGPLVLNSKPFKELDKVVPYGAFKKKARQILCLTKSNDYVVITIDAPGATYEECRNLVMKYKFPFAFALDGGSSTQTVIGKKSITPIYREKTGRKIPTVIIFEVKKDIMKINKELKKYIEENIIKEYENFDKGHDVYHVKAVIKRSLEYYKELQQETKLNINMVYTIAAYHDYGIKLQREGHAQHSKNLLLKDDKLKTWFDQNEILTMAEACNDHSTSNNKTPTTIYGKIVSDADKDTNVNIGLMRGWEFSLKYRPNLSFEERINEVHNEVVKRFGDSDIGGKALVKFYISNARNKKFMDKMIYFAYNKDAFVKKMKAMLKQKALKEGD